MDSLTTILTDKKFYSIAHFRKEIADVEVMNKECKNYKNIFSGMAMDDVDLEMW